MEYLRGQGEVKKYSRGYVAQKQNEEVAIYNGSSSLFFRFTVNFVCA